MANNNPGKQKLDDLNQELSKFEEKVLDIAAVLSFKIKEAIQDIRDETANVGQILEKNVTKEIKSLARESDIILRNTYKLKDGTAKVADIQKHLRELNIKNYGIQRSLATLQTKGIISADEKIKQEKDLIFIYEYQKGVLEEQVEEAQKLQNKIGLTGAALKGISKIPFLRDVIDTKKALEAAAGASTRIGAAFSAFKSISGDILKSLTDPVILITGLISGFQKLVELGFKANSEVVNLSKSMAVSKDEARGIRKSFIEMENGTRKFNDSLDKIFETRKAFIEAQFELADLFRATRGFTEQQVRDQVYLTQQIGLSKEEAGGLQQLAMANKMTADQVVMSTIKQTSALFKQKGIQLDNKKILGEVAKVSGQLRLQYQNNPALIAKAVVQTQKLGLSLQQAADASKKLLNFEESIEAELAAELLTGRNMNFERARLLRLNGDVAGAMEAILGEVGDINDFMNMNTIQQDSLARVAGMTTDELANSLVHQENLNKLGSQIKKQVEDKLKLLEKEGRIDEANELRRSIGNDEEAKAQLEQIDAQTKFNKLVEKLQSVLGGLVSEDMEKIIDRVATWLSKTENIEKIIKVVKETAELISKVVGFIVNHFDTIKIILTGIVSLIAIKMVAGLVSAINKAIILSRVMASTGGGGGGGGGGGFDGFSGGIGKGGIGELIKAGKYGGSGGVKTAAGRMLKASLKGNAITALTMGGLEAASSIASGEDASEAIGRTLITGLTSLAGGAAGTLLLGPGAGTIGGGIAGGMLGDKIGDWIFDKPEISKGAPTSTQQSSNINANLNTEKLATEQQKTNILLAQLVNKEGVIKYDSDRAINNNNINSYVIQ